MLISWCQGCGLLTMLDSPNVLDFNQLVQDIRVRIRIHKLVCLLVLAMIEIWSFLPLRSIVFVKLFNPLGGSNNVREIYFCIHIIKTERVIPFVSMSSFALILQVTFSFYSPSYEALSLVSNPLSFFLCIRG